MADRIITCQAVNELLFEGPNPLQIRQAKADGIASGATEIQIASAVSGKKLGLVWGQISVTGAAGTCSVWSGTAGAATGAILGVLAFNTLAQPVEILPYKGIVYAKSTVSEGLVFKYLTGTVATTSFYGSFLYVELDN